MVDRRQIIARFAEVACPPEITARRRTAQVMAEFELLLGAMPGAARRAVWAALVAVDQGARLYPPARGRRFTRLGDRQAGAYLRALLCRGDAIGGLVRRVKGLVVMCYYELPEVKSEIGYLPGPYVAAVSRRRLERYGPEIRAAEAAVLAPEDP